MRIDDLEWTLDRLEHVARHGITPEEVEEVLASVPFFKRGRAGRMKRGAKATRADIC
jgi:hypothetical protein